MTKKANTDLRKFIADHEVYYWQVAEQLGIHATTFTVKLRNELDPEAKQEVKEAVQALIAN